MPDLMASSFEGSVGVGRVGEFKSAGGDGEEAPVPRDPAGRMPVGLGVEVLAVEGVERAAELAMGEGEDAPVPIAPAGANKPDFTASCPGFPDATAPGGGMIPLSVTFGRDVPDSTAPGGGSIPSEASLGLAG